MIRFTLPKWLSPKQAPANPLAIQTPATVEVSPDVPLKLEPPEHSAGTGSLVSRAQVKAIVDASIDQAWGASSGMAAYHARQIMKHGLTEDLTAFVQFLSKGRDLDPTDDLIQDLLPAVRKFRGQGITAEFGSSLTNFGRRYMTEERCMELARLLATP